MKTYYVYIMSNKPNGVLYIGVTDNIDEGIREHKTKFLKGLFLQGIIVIN